MFSLRLFIFRFAIWNSSSLYLNIIKNGIYPVSSLIFHFVIDYDKAIEAGSCISLIAKLAKSGSRRRSNLQNVIGLCNAFAPSKAGSAERGNHPQFRARAPEGRGERARGDRGEESSLICRPSPRTHVRATSLSDAAATRALKKKLEREERVATRTTSVYHLVDPQRTK